MAAKITDYFKKAQLDNTSQANHPATNTNQNIPSQSCETIQIVILQLSDKSFSLVTNAYLLAEYWPRLSPKLRLG